MKVLITGGAGFIGLHLVEKLIKEQIDVVIVDNLTSGIKERIPKFAAFYEADIEDSTIEDIFSIEKPDYVIHLAAQVSVQVSMKNPLADCLANIAGTINLLQNCVKYNVKKFIFASSAAIYGEPAYLPIDENHPQQPISFYSLSKLTSEQYIKLYAKHFGLNYSILRFANVYGPGQNTHGEAGVISIFFLNSIFLENAPIIYGGEQTRDFVFEKDVADGIYSALHYGRNHTYNLSTNTETKINQLLTSMLKMVNSNLTPVIKPQCDGDIRQSRLDNTKAISELHWMPGFSLDRGLQETLIAINKNS
ncbi:NAD-dependent epimerase/dehydratase family protein [Neobacillus niacini]|uniref:NAD-dependent epimerase/dehydratase family protein n=1 Tax=Neobacillus niacini TaxID=86668 RepID=UPI0007AB7AEC|nr:NAD-dependent epimerase/dehydratase family protein [Neobacillus niacini]MEC1520436.1 NAD-dependent epimerase/dehydratase family protein [Neobacillus niacini]